MIAGAPDMPGGPIEIGGRVTPDLDSPEFNRFLFKDGNFQKQIDTDSPAVVHGSGYGGRGNEELP